MGFDAKAFAAALATEVAGGIKERTKEAKEYKEEQEELAQRNLPIFQKRTAQKDVLLGYARTLQKMGAKPQDIMYYMRLGPSAFQTLHKHITKRAADFKNATNGTELSAEAVQNMMKMPEEFEGTIQEQGFEEFLDKAYRLSGENDEFEAPVTEEISTGNLLKGMLGIGAKDRIKQKLRTEKFLGELSVEQINRVAAQQDFMDPYGGQDMPVLDLTTGPVIIDYDTQVSIENSATTKFQAAIGSIKKTTALLRSYFNTEGITAEKLGAANNDDLQKIEARISKALYDESVSGLSEMEEQIYNEVRDKAQFDTFKDAAGGRVSGDTVKFFGAEVQDLFDKFETKVGQSDVGADTGQKTTTADFGSKAEFKKAVDEKTIIAGKEYTYTEGGEVKTKSFTQEELDKFYKKPDVAGSKDTGILTKAEYDKIPDNDGAPGTMLTPSGKKRDARIAWFDKFEDTHYPSGKKKPYSLYLSNKGMTLDENNKIVPTPDPYADVDVSNIRG
tara:strand:+ start:949 stop:2454 length:1506 start_codon:yes stop_codon:yes gene_type:complete